MLPHVHFSVKFSLVLSANKASVCRDIAELLIYYKSLSGDATDTKVSWKLKYTAELGAKLLFWQLEQVVFVFRWLNTEQPD